MKHITVLLLLVSASSAFAAQGPAFRQNATANPGVSNRTCTVSSNATAPLALSAATRSALLFQIEEERMARELYAEFGAKYDLTVFKNIVRAETKHEAVLRQLAARAGITVPQAVAGTFSSSEVQQCYNALLILGHESADNALRAGAIVEEQDIADLRELASATDSPDLRQLVAQQEAASGHHLNAFVRNLSARGITYEAQLLTSEEFEALTTKAPGSQGRDGFGYRGGR